MQSNVDYSTQVIKDFDRIIFPQKILLNKIEYKNKNLFNQNLSSKLENYEKINNISSFYVKNFDIQYINNTYNKQQKIKCEFNTLSDYDLNPFLTHAKKEQKIMTKVINLKGVKNSIEENNYSWLGSPCSFNN